MIKRVRKKRKLCNAAQKVGEMIEILLILQQRLRSELESIWNLLEETVLSLLSLNFAIPLPADYFLSLSLSYPAFTSYLRTSFHPLVWRESACKTSPEFHSPPLSLHSLYNPFINPQPLLISSYSGSFPYFHHHPGRETGLKITQNYDHLFLLWEFIFAQKKFSFHTKFHNSASHHNNTLPLVGVYKQCSKKAGPGIAVVSLSSST